MAGFWVAERAGWTRETFAAGDRSTLPVVDGPSVIEPPFPSWAVAQIYRGRPNRRAYAASA
jgi:hypothetical protein